MVDFGSLLQVYLFHLGEEVSGHVLCHCSVACERFEGGSNEISVLVPVNSTRL
jgi:hypothetical protein